jgi:Ca2+-binding RTX toxin-like protein
MINALLQGTGPGPVPVNLTGTEQNDTINGSDQRDNIDGGGGNDTIYGYGGNDDLQGGMGDDRIEGDDGNDDLRDSQGTNILRGGAGDDRLHEDGVWLSGAGSLLDGGAGDDMIYAGGSAVRKIIGGAGNDEIWLHDGSDPAGAPGMQIDGDDGDDTIRLQYLQTPRRVDVTGGSGSDHYIFNEFIDPATVITIRDFQTGAGGDVLDVFSFFSVRTDNPFGAGGGARMVQDGNRVLLQIDADGAAGPKTFATQVVLENTTVSAFTSDNFYEGSNPDGSTRGQTVAGTALDDRIFGGRLDDLLRGLAGNDTLVGGAGNDVLEGGSGNDFLSDAQGNNRLYGGNGNDVLEAAPSGTQHLYGEAGNDRLSVTGTSTSGSMAASDILLDGGDGDDRFTIKSTLYEPLTGTVQIRGGAGDDHVSLSLTSGALSVTAEGGAGIDIYRPLMTTTTGSITITDFAAGQGGDQLDVLSLVRPDGINPFVAGLKLVQRGADTVLQGRINSEPIENNAFRDILTLKNVAASALTTANFVGGVNPDGTQNAVNLIGTAGADRLTGTWLADVMDGGAGDDVLTGGAGSDLLHGGAGIDTARYTSERKDYDIAGSAATGKWTVDERLGILNDNRDQLDAIERLQFTDGALALDLNGAAGQAYRIYRAAFDRAPDEVGLGYWIAALDRGATLGAVAGGFADSQEFRDLYGAAPSNADVVGLLYRNVLDRAPDGSGFAFWVDVLDSGRDNVAGVLASFSESGENVAAVADLIGLGIAYQPWMG